MKIKMKTSDLTKAIGAVSVVTPRPVTAQGGAGYLFVVRGQTCFLYSRDAMSVARAEIPLIEASEDGSFVYPSQYVDAFDYLGEQTTLSAEDQGEDKWVVSYEDEMGRETERMSFDPNLLSTCDRDLESSQEGQDFPAGLLKEAINLARPFLAQHKDTRVEEQHKGLLVFDSTKKESEKGNGYLYASNGTQNFYFHCELLEGKSFEAHGLYLGAILAFLAKSEGNVQIRKGTSYTFLVNSRGNVFGWPRQAKTHSKFTYYAKKNDTYKLRVPKSIITNELRLTRKSLDATRDKIKVSYDFGHSTLRFEVAEANSKAKTFAFPIEAVETGGEDQTWFVNIDHLMSLVEGVKGNEVLLHVAIIAQEGRKIALFRTIDEFRMTPEGKVVVEVEGSYPCQVTRFMPSKD